MSDEGMNEWPTGLPERGRKLAYEEFVRPIDGKERKGGRIGGAGGGGPEAGSR